MEEWTVCRLCLESSEHALKSFPDEMFESIPFYNIYFEIVGITLVDYDTFPNKICLACEDELIRAYKFRQKCLETEEKLRELPERGLRDEKIEFVTPVEQASGSIEYLEDARGPESSFMSKFIHVKRERGSDAFPAAQNSAQAARKDDAGEKIRCKQCRIIFVGLVAFYEHKCYDIAKVETPAVGRAAEGEEAPKAEQRRLFKCNECGQTFKMRSSILSHIEKHNKSKKYQCQYCKRRFYKASIRKAHIYRFHLKRTLEFKCPQCPNEYSKSSQLKAHIKEAHKEDTTFQCDRCGKNFKSCSILTSHMKIHSDKVSCAQCGKELKNLRTLERHMEIHSGQKNYICPVCQRSFTCNFSVKNHVRKIHPDDVHLLPPDGTVVNRRYLDRMAASHRKREMKPEEEPQQSDPCTSEAINSIMHN
ncbi:zinc finger protein 225-like [Phlebotomus argentipes]|uniref:zinc finger protein 225-like n=1 Tax=Phlebotomus argentipes TaxID=94469 RepID=UPI002892CF5D|nr:zinc finger protein 225-like [Phlebotomus argentipes]XP_059615912.1 zinc finger protein 225-like [Phlebotomus argentipes]